MKVVMPNTIPNKVSKQPVELFAPLEKYLIPVPGMLAD